MKKIIAASIISLCAASPVMAESADARTVWKTIMDTTPMIFGGWESQCRGAAQTLLDIRMFRSVGYTGDDVFNMLYIFNSHPNDEFGTRTLISLGFDRQLDSLSDQELARRAYRDCMEAR